MSGAPRSRHRFAVEIGAIHGGEVRFSAAAARQMRRVLRLRIGDRVIAFDGRGAELSVVLTTLRDDRAVGSIEGSRTVSTEPRLSITLWQALLPREKFELVLQKATEVGVTGFAPVATERSLVPLAAIDDARLTRWHRIAAEAAEQAGRTAVPELAAPRSFSAALASLGGQPGLIAWEREPAWSVQRALRELGPRLAGGQLNILIGPEGGFTRAEVEAAIAVGARSVSLGPRILRAETAGPILAALALYEAGDLEPTS